MARTKTTSRRKKSSKEPPPPTWDERLINSLMPWRVELLGLAIFVVSILIFMALLSLPNESCYDTPDGTRPWICLFREGFGWGAYPLLLSIAAGGLYLTLRKVERPFKIKHSQVIGFELILLTLLPLSFILTNSTRQDAHRGQGGGLVGWALSDPLLDFFGPMLTGFFYLCILVYGFSLILSFTWDDMLEKLNKLSIRLGQLSEQMAPKEEAEPTIVTESTIGLPQSNMPPVVQIDTAVAITEEESSTHGRRSKKLPPITLLQPGQIETLSQEEIDEKTVIIEETLSHFGLPARVISIQQGPAVTQFGVEPGYIEKPGSDGEIKQQKVRVNQIASLRKDIALALAAQRLRIQAPVPGKGIVGIEVPNHTVSLVRLRSIIESEEYSDIKAPLTVGLGADVSGRPVAVDLAKLPHLLIAGTTGSGKSVCMNAIIACLVFNNPPEKLQLVMVDPKKVEFIRFNGLPHLIGQVEVEADRAVGVLRWLTAEMDRRYELFSIVNARNLNGYNRKVANNPKYKKLPYIAVFIDELADLMHTYPGDVERTLCRLAQMARATGIHLVVATQRPSTDVITGLIKANFPSRMSFAVASGTDSRVILDSVGAEQLLGKGDMLFLPPDAPSPGRVQGVFVNDLEVEGIVHFWQDAMPEDYEPMPAPWESLIAKHALLDETDSMLEQAIELCQKYDTISTSLLQRRLRVGFPRAARIMEHLYEMGLVEDPKDGGKTRKTYVEEDDEDPLTTIISDRD